MREPVVVAYGGGVDSTAMIVEMVRLKEPIDLILFADTGGELPQTYAYVEMFSAWLVSRGYPPVTTVLPRNRAGEVIKLETECLRLGTLPSLAFGWHTCSARFKLEPQEKFLKRWAPAIEAWAAGVKVVKLVGFECGEEKRTYRMPENPLYRPRFPLQEWGWNRARCVAEIEAAGLPSPGKSACFFCPARKKAELIELERSNPDLAARAIAMEERALASGKLKKTPGLGRSFSWKAFFAGDRHIGRRSRTAKP